MITLHKPIRLSPYVPFDEVLAPLYDRLGQVVLLPFDDDGKPLAELVAFDETQTPAYLRKLSTSNITARCGPTSDGLGALVFTDREALERFLESNPRLRQTALRGDKNQFTLFIRVRGFQPHTMPLPDCEWRGHDGGVTVWFRRAFTRNDKWMNDHKPLELGFFEIAWPEAVRRLFVPEWLATIYHSPFYTHPGRQPVLNYAYWGALFADFHKVKYCPDSQTFYEFDGEMKEWAEVSVARLKARLLEFMLHNGTRPKFEFLLRPRSERELDDLIKSLRLVAIGEEEAPGEALQAFVAECMETFGGGDVTVEELYSAFSSYCDRIRQSRLTKSQFFDKSRPLIERRYAIGRSHSIERNGRARRGYHNLRLQMGLHNTGSEVPGTAGTG